ncbi:MAG TPA: ATP-binding cassette domain-containing protein [Propionibacteriaceae bacterium]|jgi:putative ABC transport system ATP-binding protein|nr:ATP-binding cassette domain-containing protein [Propionibacteriaceae bacterium]
MKPTVRGVALDVRGVVHIYRSEGHDVAALAGVDLRIDPGDLVGLLGPSGSGKSTLLTLCAGLFSPSAGTIRMNGTDLAAMSEADLDTFRATTLGIVLQGAGRNLLSHLTTRDSIAHAQYPARIRGASLQDPDEVLVALQIGHLTELRPRELTAGQRQLVALAVGVATNPGLLLADEPTSQLTGHERERVIDALHRVNSAGTTVLVVTHDAHLASAMTRTVTIRDGRLGRQAHRGRDYVQVTRDGAVPLPVEALEHMPAGTQVTVSRRPDGWLIVPENQPGAGT